MFESIRQAWGRFLVKIGARKAVTITINEAIAAYRKGAMTLQEAAKACGRSTQNFAAQLQADGYVRSAQEVLDRAASGGRGALDNLAARYPRLREFIEWVRNIKNSGGPGGGPGGGGGGGAPRNSGFVRVPNLSTIMRGIGNGFRALGRAARSVLSGIGGLLQMGAAGFVWLARAAISAISGAAQLAGVVALVAIAALGIAMANGSIMCRAWADPNTGRSGCGCSAQSDWIPQSVVELVQPPACSYLLGTF
ncbi:MAG: hypothetical protein AAF841_14610 [Pseudomonadota bacterium]